jgi:hypothetical protein
MNEKTEKKNRREESWEMGNERTRTLGLPITPDSVYIFLEIESQRVFWPRGEEAKKDPSYVN